MKTYGFCLFAICLSIKKEKKILLFVLKIAYELVSSNFNKKKKNSFNKKNIPNMLFVFKNFFSSKI